MLIRGNRQTIGIPTSSGRWRNSGENAAMNGERQAAVWLLSEFVKKRTGEYRAALELWGEWKASHFSERMQTAIQSSSNETRSSNFARAKRGK